MNTRTFCAAAALACGALLAFGYYLQFAKGLEPCPLCIFQRIAYWAIGLTALAGLVHGAGGRWRYVYGGLILLLAGIGAVIAGRQVWMQYLPPDQVPECGPGLDYMLEVFPLSDVVRMAFTGSGECAEVDWTFLSLSVAEWSLAWFIAFAVAAVVFMVRRGKGISVTR